jgi:septal ring factor EnvC (AmiA/AmiB activator)
MADLRSALLAAADEAEKLQKDLDLQRTKISILEAHVEYLETENNTLKTKLRNVGDLMRQAANIFEEN